MSKFTKIADFKLPELPYRFVGGGEDYSNKQDKIENVQKLKNIKAKYGIFIKKWATVFELGEPVLTAFVAIESSGKMVGKNQAGAIGLTQVTLVAIIESISKFKTVTGESLPAEAVDLINKKAPYLLDLTPNKQDVSKSNSSKLEALLEADANFNIMMGAICLRWALDFTGAGNLVYLQKAIIAYNQSPYGRIRAYRGNFVSTSTLFRDKIIPKETRNYLVKALGKDGFLELFVVNNL